MSGGLAILVLAGLAFFASLAFTGFMAHAGVGDEPNARSAHRNIVPTAGGVGVIAGIGFCLLALPSLLPNLDMPDSIPPFLSILFGIAFLGLVDDLFALPPALKSLIFIPLCCLAVWVISPVRYLPLGAGAIELPYLIGFAGCVLWLFTVTNVVNFIDGSNGIMGLSMALSFFALIGIGFVAAAPTSALLAMVFMAAIVGFLPYNFRASAQVFAGDVGALCVGFAYAGLVLIMAEEARNLSVVYAGPLLILPFLTDSLLTMLRRAKKGEPIWRAHNQHVYQRLIRAGRGHVNVAWRYGFMTLIMGNLAIYGASQGWLVSPLILAVPVGVGILLYALASKRLPD